MAVKLEKVLDVFLEDNENEYMPECKRKEDAVLRYKVHRHLKGADAVKDELYANLCISEMRIIAVKDAVEAKNYAEAEKLCLEQAKKILFLGNEEFWDVLKRLYQSQSVWESQKPILLEELRKSKYTVCYRSILVEENEKELLLKAVSENPYDLFYYGQFLVKDYSNELYALCANYIREKCAQATDRRLYKKVCKDLLQLIKWKGNVTAKMLVEEFKANYSRKPALLDELQKVEKKL